MLGDPTLREARRSELVRPHVQPLTRFVKNLRAEVGGQFAVPDFDPWDGGINAELLFLLEAPGPKARESGFVSRNNPDETAKNFFELNCEAGIPRRSTLMWNVVPWYIGTGHRIRAATGTDLEAGLRPLPRLLGLLPHLRVIVLVGRKAERARALASSSHPNASLLVCPHPSPMFVNRAPANREKILAVLRQAAQLVAVGRAGKTSALFGAGSTPCPRNAHTGALD